MKSSTSSLRLFVWALLITATLSGALSACSFLKRPTMADISMAADEKLNVDSRGRSTPVVVRYYILKNSSAFNSADFFSLAEKDQQTLSDAIVSREEFILKPGEQKRFGFKEVGQGQEFAVMASFRDIDHATWRATAPLPPNTVTVIGVSLKNNQITLIAKSR